MSRLECDYTALHDLIGKTIQKLKDSNKEYKWLLDEKGFWERVIMNEKALRAGVLKCPLHESVGIDISNGMGLREMAYLLENELNEICLQLDNIKRLENEMMKIDKEVAMQSENIRKNVFETIRLYRDGNIPDTAKASVDYHEISKMLYERAKNLLDIDEKNDSIYMAETLEWIATQLKNSKNC